MKNELYWSYNLPLQFNQDRVLNYMPRKERVEWLELEEVLGEETRQEYFETAAKHFENLARLFREAANDPEAMIYYHDEGMTP